MSGTVLTGGQEMGEWCKRERERRRAKECGGLEK